MSFVVRELPRAMDDKERILDWLLDRSRQGAAAWLTAYDDALDRLRSNANAYGPALEDEDCPSANVRQMLFKTRQGRVYRILFLVQDTDVYVLRVRGPGQPPLHADEM